MNVNYEPLDNDIEDCTDLAPHEKSVISKCLTRESSSSCFQLLIDILNRAMYIDPKEGHILLLKVLTQYWPSLIALIPKPESHSY